MRLISVLRIYERRYKDMRGVERFASGRKKNKRFSSRAQEENPS